MTLRTRIEAAAAAVALLLALYAWHAWRAEGRARAAAESQAASAQKDFTQAAARIADLKKQDAAREAVAARQIARIKALSEAAKTPAQIVKWIPTQVPLPAPVILRESNGTNGTNGVGSGGPQYAAIPAADLDPLKDFIVQAKECAVELPAARQDLSSCQAQAKLAGEQLAAAERERDAYKTALQGGTLWRRLGHDLKVAGIGAAIGAAAVCGSGHCR